MNKKEIPTSKKFQPMAYSGEKGGVNTLKIDSQIIPLYPVRYAYANFFEEKLSKASEPPELNTFLHATDINTTKGYVLRLLRAGWIYLREEDDPGNGLLHIFKYEQVKDQNGKVTERFPKYLFKNGVNAQDGLVQDRSGQRPDGYPFVFAGKGVKKVSIVYSEHEWHPDVIDKMHSSESERHKCMQFIDLEAETDTHTIKASAENLGKLVEDYRKRKNKLLNLKESADDPELKDISLAVLTTEASYEMDADDIAFELQKKTAYDKTAKIVALHDPVGRQREIVEAHAKLSIWQKDAASTDIYPFMIGKIVNDLKNHENKKVAKVVKNSINWTHHDHHWKKMKKEVDEFENRQIQFAGLYKSFMLGSETTGKVGSLDTYFKKFFCPDPQNNKLLKEELQKLCNISAAIYAGMLSSPAAKAALEEVLCHAADQGEIENTTNATVVVLQFFKKIVTTPQIKVQWNHATAKAVDNLLLSIGWVWGEAVALHKNGLLGTIETKSKPIVSKLSYKALDMFTDLMPGMLNIYGYNLNFDKNNIVTLSDENLNSIINKKTTNSKDFKKAMGALDKAMNKARRSQKLFDWANSRKRESKSTWKLAQIQKNYNKTSTVSIDLPENFGKRVGLVLDTGFAGISVFFNAVTINSIMAQTRFSQASPLHQGTRFHTMMNFTSAAASLTIDLMTVGKAGALATDKLLQKTHGLANAIAPRVQGAAKSLTRILGSRLAMKLVAAANFAGAVASGLDAYNAFKVGNKKEAYGHMMISAASAVMCAQAICALATAGTKGGLVAAPTGVGLIVFGISMLVLGIGAAFVYIYGKSEFQVLLENCFWGNGDKYAFWADTKTRPEIEGRLGAAREIHQTHKMMTYYNIELHEFMNYLYMPKLEVEKSDPPLINPLMANYKRTIHYTFTLPGFLPGVSEIETDTFYYPPTYPATMVPKRKYSKMYARDLYKSMEKAEIKYDNGSAIINVEIIAHDNVYLDWYYKPQPEMIVPLRLLAEGGMRKETQIISGMIDEEPC